jgi:hypothetical protein
LIRRQAAMPGTACTWGCSGEGNERPNQALAAWLACKSRSWRSRALVYASSFFQRQKLPMCRDRRMSAAYGWGV